MIKATYAFLIIWEYSYFPWRYISSDLRDISDFTRFSFTYSTPPPRKSFLEVKSYEHLGFLTL